MLGLERFFGSDERYDDEGDDVPGIDWTLVRLQSSELERRTTRMERHRVAVEPMSNVIDLHFAPPRWTQEPPTGPGLYFVKATPNGPCRVVEVFRHGNVLLAEWSDITSFRVAGSGYLFSDQALVEPEG